MINLKTAKAVQAKPVYGLGQSVHRAAWRKHFGLISRDFRGGDDATVTVHSSSAQSRCGHGISGQVSRVTDRETDGYAASYACWEVGVTKPKARTVQHEAPTGTNCSSTTARSRT
eukprot:gene1451-4610_t